MLDEKFVISYFSISILFDTVAAVSVIRYEDLVLLVIGNNKIRNIDPPNAVRAANGQKM